MTTRLPDDDLPGRGASPRPWPELGIGKNVLWLSVLGVSFALLFATSRYLEGVATGHARHWVYPYVEELTGAVAAISLIPLIVWVGRRWPLLEPGGWKRLPVHLLALLAYGALATSWMWASRSLIFPSLGFGAYDYGFMPVRYLMELPKQATVFGLVLVFTTLLDRQDAARKRELRLSRIETELAHAELHALHAQLRPHFLFNAMNAISSVMYVDVRRADRMLNLLADLLRWSLRSSQDGEVPLHAELAATERYLELMRGRFEERLVATVEMEPPAAEARVPALILQPLVENATEHGMPEPPRVAEIRVRARREDATVVLEVEDNGPGPVRLSGRGNGRGLGLRNTEARLRALYGEHASLELVPGALGGAVARLRFPFTPHPAAREASAVR